jgi:hypothetical protein
MVQESKSPVKISSIYTYDVNFLTLLGTPYIYISRLRVKEQETRLTLHKHVDDDKSLTNNVPVKPVWQPVVLNTVIFKVCVCGVSEHCCAQRGYRSSLPRGTVRLFTPILYSKRKTNRGK